MPYVPRKTRTTTYKKMPSAPRGRLTQKTVAAIAKKVVNKQIETKKLSTEVTEQALSTIGGVEDQSLVNTALGDGQGGRDGHMLQPVGIDVRGHVKNNTTNPVIFKVCLVKIKNNEADPSTDFLETNAGNVSLTGNDLSTMYRRVNSDSYQILTSRMMKIGVEEDNVKMFKMWLPMKKMRKLIYEGISSSEPKYNRIHLIAFGRGTGNDNENITLELTYNSTFYFKDA